MPRRSRGDLEGPHLHPLFRAEAPPFPPMSILIDKIRAAVEARAKQEKRRYYIGASSVGAECERQCLFNHVHASDDNHSADTLFRFEDGHRTEDLIAERIRLVDGVELFTHKPDGSQFGFSALNGHFRGHIDGVIKGHPELDEPAIWECKATSEKNFRAFKRLKEKRRHEDVLLKWNEVYYGQAMLYCHFFDLDYHYLSVATPGGRDLDDLITPANGAYATSLIDKAKSILENPELPPRISADPKFFKCAWCAHHRLCHRESGDSDPIQYVNQNCRTCKFAEPIMDGEDGGWRCATHNVELTEEGQSEGCELWVNAWLN